jgi:hypothetical protein
MLKSLRNAWLAAALVAAPGLALPALADGPVMLTVTGNVEQPNRGGFDETKDVFFGFNEVAFDKAAAFDYEALVKLNQVKVKADFPKDGPVREFEGPLLADVLAAAGASGDTVVVRALDGYAVEAKLKDLVDQGAVVALKRDGQNFGLGDFGPTQIVFPRAERSDLKDMPDDNWVWSIYHITVK